MGITDERILTASAKGFSEDATKGNYRASAALWRNESFGESNNNAQKPLVASKSPGYRILKRLHG